jgi:anaerobic selenocysteine-containing dehydrogenase
VEAPDPEAANKFQLAAGDMPSALNTYREAAVAKPGFDYRLVSRRTKHRFNSTGGHLTALKAKRTTNPAHIHPDDLAALGIKDGALVSITSPVGSIVGVAEAAPGIRRGIVSMAHAWGDAGEDGSKVREIGAGTNRLVKETVDYDPITGQSLQSAIPVRIEAL